MNDLPPDIVRHIAASLGSRDLVRFAATSKTLADIVIPLVTPAKRRESNAHTHAYVEREARKLAGSLIRTVIKKRLDPTHDVYEKDLLVHATLRVPYANGKPRLGTVNVNPNTGFTTEVIDNSRRTLTLRFFQHTRDIHAILDAFVDVTGAFDYVMYDPKNNIPFATHVLALSLARKAFEYLHEYQNDPKQQKE